MRRFLSVVALLAALIVTAPASAGVVAPPVGFQPFAADSPVNLALRDDAPIHARSTEWMDWLNNDATNSVGVRGGYFNTGTCAMPAYWASADTPRVQIKLNPNQYQDAAIKKSWESVPRTEEMVAATCSDGNLAIFQTQPDGTVDEWEFWQMKRGYWNDTNPDPAITTWAFTADPEGELWARHGGATQDVEADRGWASPLQWTGNPSDPVFLARKAAWNMNVTATGMNVTAGVVTPEDVEDGVIDHVVGFAMPDSLAGKYLFPSQRYDGGVTETATRTPMPEGVHMRLPASFDVDAWAADTQPNTAGLQPAPPLVEMVARAAQKYGIIGRDRSFSCWCFYGEEVKAGQPNPYGAAMNGVSMTKGFTDRGGSLNGYFPWEDMVVLDSTLCTGVSGSGCHVAARSVDIQTDAQVPKVGDALSLDTRNSVLEQPRKLVEVDVDGDGIYEVDAGKDVIPVVTPLVAGSRTVSVRITTRDNAVTTGTLVIDVAPDVVAEPETLVPDQLVDRTYWYGWCGTDILVEVTNLTSCHRAYAGAAAGRLEVRFPDTTLASVASLDATAYVSSSATLTTKVHVMDAAGVVLGYVLVPNSSTGEVVTVHVAGPFTPAEANGLKVVAKTVGSYAADAQTTIRNIRLTLTP